MALSLVYDLEPQERSPRPGELVVGVRASSVNPVDAFIAMGALRERVEHEFPLTLGRDFAGVVERVGADVTRHRTGDEVFGFLPATNPTVRDGSWAELIVLPEDDFVAAKPDGVDTASAGAAPVAALTAIAAFDALSPAEGEDVPLVGATGGVGSFFVQLAASAGANVIAPALAEDEAYLRDLGAGEILDRDSDVAAAVRETHPDGVAAVFDVVSRAPDASLLAEGGRLASPLGAAGEGAGASTSWRCPPRPTSSGSESSSPRARSACRSSAPIRSSRPARPSRSSRRPTPGGSSA